MDYLGGGRGGLARDARLIYIKRALFAARLPSIYPVGEIDGRYRGCVRRLKGVRFADVCGFSCLMCARDAGKVSVGFEGARFETGLNVEEEMVDMYCASFVWG